MPILAFSTLRADSAFSEENGLLSLIKGLFLSLLKFRPTLKRTQYSGVGYDIRRYECDASGVALP